MDDNEINSSLMSFTTQNRAKMAKGANFVIYILSLSSDIKRGDLKSHICHSLIFSAIFKILSFIVVFDKGISSTL